MYQTSNYHIQAFVNGILITVTDKNGRGSFAHTQTALYGAPPYDTHNVFGFLDEDVKCMDDYPNTAFFTTDYYSGNDAWGTHHYIALIRV